MNQDTLPVKCLTITKLGFYEDTKTVMSQLIFQSAFINNMEQTQRILSETFEGNKIKICFPERFIPINHLADFWEKVAVLLEKGVHCSIFTTDAGALSILPIKKVKHWGLDEVIVLQLDGSINYEFGQDWSLYGKTFHKIRALIAF